MNILVTGANGQLGSELRRLERCGVTTGVNCYIFTDIADNKSVNIQKLDISDVDAVNNFVEENHIEFIINCAAYTNVDKAEDDFYMANLINNEAVANLANVCKKKGAFLIHISTDYVFGGATGNLPYGEDETANPLGIYGETKLAGEESIKRILGNYLIFRTAWLYSEYGNNFVKTMRKLMKERESLSIVFDQIGTPTYAEDLASAIYKIVEEGLYNSYTGIYHFSNEGVCSWYDFAVAIGEMSGTGGTKPDNVGERICHILPCHSEEFPSKVKRPSFSVLDKTKIKRDFGVAVPYWRNSLLRCMERL